MSQHSKPDALISEDAIVQRYFAPLAVGLQGAMGLQDDAALLSPSDGEAFVVSTDCLVAGRHFLFDGSAENARDIGWRALACNVSDLIAKGSVPHCYQLSLSLPDDLPISWLADFAQGLQDVQKYWKMSLSGGDTVRSGDALNISITAIGVVSHGVMIRRDGAQIGDVVVVTGTIGDALAGLKLARGDEDAKSWEDLICADAVRRLVGSYWRPSPPAAIVQVLRDYATAAMDISDGLVIDLMRLCAASGVGVSLDLASVPLSDEVQTLVRGECLDIEDLLTAGDDYQVLVCVPDAQLDRFLEAAHQALVPTAVVGKIRRHEGLDVIGEDGQPHKLTRLGWDHFRQ